MPEMYSCVEHESFVVKSALKMFQPSLHSLSLAHIFLVEFFVLNAFVLLVVTCNYNVI